MKKKGRIILLVVAIGVSIGLAYGLLRVAPSQRIGENLLKNSNFEAVRRGKIKTWEEDPSGGWSVSTEGAYEGENCMQATVGWSWLSQEIRVKPDKYYILKAYLKSDIPVSGENGGGNAFFGFDYLDVKGQVIEEDYSIINTTSFWQQEIRQIYAPPKTNKIRVKLAKRQGEGSVWFDEFEIVKLTWYMKSAFLQRIAEDKPFFIFYFSVYFILLLLLLRLILKRQPFSKRQRAVLGKKSKESQN